MNKQIQELAEQAGYTPLPGFDFANDLQEIFLQKFAELIVRECMKELMDGIVYSDQDIAETSNPLHREYLKGNNRGIVDAVVRFRNHFGIKE